MNRAFRNGAGRSGLTGIHAASVALSRLSYGPKRPMEYRNGR